MILIDGVCHVDIETIESSPYDNETIKAIDDNIVELLKDNSTIIGDNFTGVIYISGSEPQNQTQISLDDCISVLKRQNHIDDPLIIAQFSFQSSSYINETKFKIYDINGNLLDTSVCSGLNIIITIPINNNTDINLTQAEEIYSNGIDIFDASSPFYTDLCFVSYIDTSISQRMKNFIINYEKRAASINFLITVRRQ